MAHFKYPLFFSRLGPLFLLLALCFLAHSKSAHACNCGPASISVWPSGNKAVPLNTQIWVRLPALNPKLAFEKHSDFKKYPRFWSSRFQQSQLAILVVDSKKSSLAVYKTDLQVGQWRMSVLRPQAPLLPNQTYKVYLQASDSLSSQIASFRTGTQVETKATAQAGIQRARFVWERTLPGACGPPKPYVVLDASKSPNPSAFYGIWLADAKGNINYKEMPSVVLKPEANQLFLGQTSPCMDKNFVFPAQSRVTLGVRLGNLSGNWGPPQTVSFASKAPLEPWSWSPNARVLFWVVLGFVLVLLSVFRTWLFQRDSNKVLDDFLNQFEEVKSDMAWLSLKQLAKKEGALRLRNFLVFCVQGVLFFLGLYVWMQGQSHFSVSAASQAELSLAATIWGIVLLLNAVIHLYFTAAIRSKRRNIRNLPMSHTFEDSSKKLLKRW